MDLPPDFSLSLYTDNGSVPPRYRTSRRITICASGEGERAVSHGYGAEMSTTPFMVPKEDLVALYADLVALGLFSTEWRQSDRRTVGGGSKRLDVSADGVSVDVPTQLVQEQREARNAIVERIATLVSEAD